MIPEPAGFGASGFAAAKRHAERDRRDAEAFRLQQRYRCSVYFDVARQQWVVRAWRGDGSSRAWRSCSLSTAIRRAVKALEGK